MATRLATDNSRAGYLGFPAIHLAKLTPVILTQLKDFVVVAKVAVVAIFPDVASVGIEEWAVTSAIRESNTGVGSLCHDGLGL
jgi:hypothetical protein